MGKKSAPTPPPAPDPNQVAAAQAGLNKETAETQARLNRVNEVTPFGSVTYTSTGNEDAPYQRTMTLDPAEQALLDSQRGTELKLSDLGGTILDRVSPNLATPFSIEGSAPVANDETRQRVEQALLERMQPQLDNDRAALETQLANQGFARDSEAYNAEIDKHNRAVNDARLATIAAGGQEQSRLFGLDMASRQQMLQEAALERSQPLNEIASILGTGQVNAPNFGAVPQVGVAPTDITGPTYAKYNADMNAFNQSQNSRNRAMGGLFGLAGSALSAGLSPGGFLLG